MREDSVDGLTIWITYHDSKQLEDYSLKNDTVFKLFKGNEIDIEGENINYLNKFYSELTTMYWVYKNSMKSKYIGFCHYRRIFTRFLQPNENECQVLSILKMTTSIYQQYKASHNYNDLDDILDILSEIYGADNVYNDYLLNSHTFVPFCCFIMNFDDFVSLCEFIFPILFAYDKKHKLSMNPALYMRKIEKDFRYGDHNYQCRAIAFLAERLISCFICCRMKPYSITNLK